MSQTCKKQILVVEDEGIIAADLQRRLERMGFSVPRVAASGRQALQLSRQTPYDLVLMDIGLQGDMDGIRAAQALREERDVPVIYITAYGDSGTIDRAKTTAFGYILKPIGDASLRAAVEISLHKHGADCDVAKDLKETRERCGILSHRLSRAREDECRRLARELHDDVQQRLIAIALELEVEQRENDQFPRSRAMLRGISSKLCQLSTDMHRLSHDLHPQVLENLGLVRAISRLCRHSGEGGLTVYFQHGGLPAVIPPPIAVSLYRIAQESLANVVKHAATNKASVSLYGTPLRIRLCVFDRGVGFDPEVVRGTPLGFVNMADRVGSVGGTLQVTSKPGRGTRITALIPLSRMTEDSPKTTDC